MLAQRELSAIGRGLRHCRDQQATGRCSEGETEGPYHLVGHDIGAWIAYAWAAQFPDRLKSLTLLDASVPGCSAPREFPLPYEANIKLWQFSFNALPELPEILTQGRESDFILSALFGAKQTTTVTSGLPPGILH
jgi:pimeloyl-ACP methyl ester carboxylesterase